MLARMAREFSGSKFPTLFINLHLSRFQVRHCLNRLGWITVTIYQILSVNVPIILNDEVRNDNERNQCLRPEKKCGRMPDPMCQQVQQVNLDALPRCLAYPYLTQHRCCESEC
jgi:hypothetical protein